MFSAYDSNNRPQVRSGIIAVQIDRIQARDDTIQIQSVLALQFVTEEDGQFVEIDWLLADDEQDDAIRNADSIADRLRDPAGRPGGLLYPVRHLRGVERVAFVDVDPARVLILAGAGRHRLQRSAFEESHLHIFCEAMDVEKPALALDAVKRRVPLHGFAHVGNVARDKCVETLPEIALPAGHRGDVRLHWSIAVGLRDLRIAA